ncbi:hypothetical protein FRC12_015146, partial [Ceratobasidium sp. 428]
MPLGEVLQIPELSRLVSRSLSQKDTLQIAIASRRFFHLFIPLLWETIHGATRLFILIEGTRTNRQSANIFSDRACEIIVRGIGGCTSYGCLIVPTPQVLPEVVNEQTLARIRFYGAFVKFLTVFEDNRTTCSLMNWQALWIQTRDQALLPNLVSCILFNDDFMSFSQLPWLTLFISPVLQELRVKSMDGVPPPYTSPRTCYSVLRILIENKADLHILAIFPDEGMKPGGTDAPAPNYQSSFSQCKETNNFRSFLQHTKLLTSLSTTKFMLLQDDVLGLVSGSTILESLNICQGASPGDLPIAALSSEAFPALKHLGLLHFFTDTTIQDFYKTLPGVINKLTSLEIQYHNRHPNKRQSISSFISLICH